MGGPAAAAAAAARPSFCGRRVRPRGLFSEVVLFPAVLTPALVLFRCSPSADSVSSYNERRRLEGLERASHTFDEPLPDRPHLDRRSKGQASRPPPPPTKASLERISTGYGRPDLSRSSGEALARAGLGVEGYAHLMFGDSHDTEEMVSHPAPKKAETAPKPEIAHADSVARVERGNSARWGEPADHEAVV